jgi:hypothetical protein
MILGANETLGPVAADTWVTTTNTVAGPGVYVYLIDAPLGDTDTLQAQVVLNPEGAGTWMVVEDVTSVATDLSSFAGWAGFQSAPVPLVDGGWQLMVRAKHDAATDMTFTVRVIKL